MDVVRVNSGYLSTHNRVDVVVAIGCPLTTIKRVLCTVVSWTATPQVVGVAIPNAVLSNLIRSQDWLDIELAILDKGCGPVVVIDLELIV